MIKIKIIPKFNSYRIVVANALSKRDGRVIKQIGFVDFARSCNYKFCIDILAFKGWLKMGALPTKAVLRLLDIIGLVY